VATAFGNLYLSKLSKSVDESANANRQIFISRQLSSLQILWQPRGGVEVKDFLGGYGGGDGLVALSIMGIMSSECVSGMAVQAHPPPTLCSFPYDFSPLAIASAVNFYVFLKRPPPGFRPY